MRIAMLANMYGPKSGGIKTTLNSLSQQYEKLGHEVLVITPSDKDFVEQVGFIKKVSIASPSIPYTGGYRIIVRSKKIIEVLNSFHPDIIEISDRTTLISVARWARGKKIPTVFFAHERLDGVLSAFLPRFPFRRLLITNWNRLTNRIFTRIVATTEYAAFEFKKIKSQKLSIVPLGVDLEVFTPNWSMSGRGQGGEKFNYLISATRLSKEKDPLLLIEISRALQRKNINTPILIYGTGPMLQKMQEIVDAEDLNIYFMGYLSDKRQLAARIANADVYLAPGPIETFGLSALEALACGTPVLCRESSALKEIIDSSCGVALPRQAEAWVVQIENLQRYDRIFIAKKARNRAENFSWSDSAKSLLSLHTNNLKSSVTIPETSSFAK